MALERLTTDPNSAGQQDASTKGSHLKGARGPISPAHITTTDETPADNDFPNYDTSSDNNSELHQRFSRKSLTMFFLNLASHPLVKVSCVLSKLRSSARDLVSSD